MRHPARRRRSIWFGAVALIASGVSASQTPPPLPKETPVAAAADSAEDAEGRGAALEKKNDLAGAASAYREAVARRKQHGELLAAAAALQRLGSIQLRQSEFDESEGSFKECLDIRRRLAPGTRDEASAWNGLGGIAYSRGDLHEAEQHYGRALAILGRVAPEGVEAARTTGNLGMVFFYRGDLEHAEELYRRALTIQEKLDPEGVEAASPLNYLGLVAKNRGDFDSAEQYYRRAIAIFEKKSPGSLAVAGMLNNVGVLARERGDTTAAEVAQRKALEIRRRQAPDSLDVASSLNNLGEIALLREDLDNAEVLLREALAIKAKSAPKSLVLATTLFQLGELHLRRHDLPRAKVEVREVLEIRNRLAPGSQDQAVSFALLAAVEKASGDREEAAADFRRAIEAVEAQRSKVGGTDLEHAAFSGRSIGIYRDAIALLHELGRDEEAFDLLERSRARELLALMARRDLHLDTSGPSDLLAQRRRLDSDYDRVQQQMGRIDPISRKADADRLVARLFELRQTRASIDQKVWSASPRIRDLENPSTLTLTEVRNGLDPGTVLLSYSIGERESLLFVVGSRSRGSAPLAVFALGKGRDGLENEIGIFLSLIRAERDDLALRPTREEAGRRLFQRLVAPAVASIAAGKRILICPDGPLHLLPFGALTTQERGKESGSFLAEWRPLHVAISATVARGLAHRRGPVGAKSATLVAFGDPRSGESARPAGPEAGYRSVAARAQTLAPIPSTREEVDSVVSSFGLRAEKYVGPSATEARVGSEGPKARYLHFACHAVLDSRFPLDSALVLAPPEVEHPGTDNGLLQAWEIYERLRLDADLVTLSACDTALGKESGGEGLVGLVRAFHFAGARSVLATLWNISDRSTPALMAEFYRGLKAHLPMDEALRQAQRASIRGAGRLSAPYFWAAFELIGDWR